ncbi:hypothetical protein PIB30_102129, partial [Stylosanthes scabra]|nr:hypothetical protein [Stylosanthes scabra]
MKDDRRNGDLEQKHTQIEFKNFKFAKKETIEANNDGAHKNLKGCSKVKSFKHVVAVNKIKNESFHHHEGNSMSYAINS